MKKSERPQAVDRADQYTAGDIAIIYGVAHRSACKMIDSGILVGHRIPIGQGERRVFHADVMAHIRKNLPNFGYALDRIIGLSEAERAGR